MLNVRVTIVKDTKMNKLYQNCIHHLIKIDSTRTKNDGNFRPHIIVSLLESNLFGNSAFRQSLNSSI